MEIDTTQYVLCSETDLLVATAAPTEGFTTTAPTRMVVTEGHRGCRIILLAAPASATNTIAAVTIMGIDTVRPSREVTKGWFLTTIGVTSALTFNGTFTATVGRDPVLSAPSIFATYTEDASFTPRRVYATGISTLGVPAAGVAPWFEILIPDLANLHGISIWPTGAFGAATTNFNAYVALDR